jgi:hypothetical protein
MATQIIQHLANDMPPVVQRCRVVPLRSHSARLWADLIVLGKRARLLVFRITSDC